MKLKLKKLEPRAIIPNYATAGAAAFDLHALESGHVLNGKDAVIRTGLAFEIPEGYVMLVVGRSGHGFKHNVRLANCLGVIDSDYRGEVMVKLVTDSDQTALYFEAGERIAQAMIVPVAQVELTEVEDLSETARGENGFGSTGVM